MEFLEEVYNVLNTETGAVAGTLLSGALFLLGLGRKGLPHIKKYLDNRFGTLADRIDKSEKWQRQIDIANGARDEKIREIKDEVKELRNEVDKRCGADNEDCIAAKK